MIDLELRRIHSLLLETISQQKDYMQSFVIASSETLTLTDSRGAAVFHEGELKLLGQTPAPDQVKDLLAWIQTQIDEIDYLYCTSTLAREYTPATHYSDVASGVLVIQVAKPQQSYILWFRPEVVQEVNWGGKPDKFVVEEEDGKHRLHPRKSFARWKEQVTQTSLAWEEHHVEVAHALGNALKDIFVFKAEEYRQQKEELEQLNRKLKQEVKVREQVQRQLEASNTELEDFAYVVSHDLKSPLNNLRSLLNLYNKELIVDENNRQVMQRIDKSVDKLGGMLASFMSVFLMNENMKAPSEEIALEKSLNDITRNLDQLIGEANTTVHTDFSAVPTLVFVPALFQSILQNLITNAIKYRSPERDPVIRIHSEAKGDFDVIYFQDNGIGIDTERNGKHLFKLFKRFNTKHAEGSGVGLYMVNSILESSGGRIEIDSELGQGTLFRLYFAKAKKEVAGLPYH